MYYKSKGGENLKENQLLRDSNINPTTTVISSCLGSAIDTYKSFTDKLKNHNIEPNWRYYNDGKAWLFKGIYKWSTIGRTEKETTAFWLSVWEGFFRVTIFIPEKYRTEALNLPLSNKTKEMITNSEQMGKLKFFSLVFNLQSSELFDEIFTLIDFRKMLK